MSRAGISAGYLGPAPGGVVTTAFPLTAINGNVDCQQFREYQRRWRATESARLQLWNWRHFCKRISPERLNALECRQYQRPATGSVSAALNYGSGNIRISTAVGNLLSIPPVLASQQSNKAPSTPGFVVPSTTRSPYWLSVLLIGANPRQATAANDPAAGILAGYNPNNSNVLGQ